MMYSAKVRAYAAPAVPGLRVTAVQTLTAPHLQQIVKCVRQDHHDRVACPFWHEGEPERRRQVGRGSPLSNSFTASALAAGSPPK